MARRRQEEEMGFDGKESRGQKIVKTVGRFKSERGNSESIWQQIADHVVGRGDFTTETDTDRVRDYFIYDPTAVNQSQRLAAHLYSILIAGRFFAIESTDPDLQADDDVREWMRDTSLRVLTALTAPTSNFSNTFHEAIQELIDFGTAGVITTDVPGKGMRYSSVPLGQLYIGEDAHGKVNTVMRRFKMKNRQVADRWGQGKGDKDFLARLNEEGRTKPEEDRWIVHSLMPNDGTEDILGSKKPFVGDYVDEKTKVILETRFFDESPIPVARWSRIPGIAYGGSCGRNALSAQAVLNEIERTTLAAGQKAVSPPLLVPNDGTLSQAGINADPESLIPYTPDISGQRGPGIQYLESAARFDVSDAAMDRRQNAVKEAYYSAMDSVPNGPYFTATHIGELSRMAVKYMGPMLERVQFELIEPIIKRQFSSMLRAGKLRPAPPQLGGESLKIRYVSPAMRAQMAEEGDSIRKYRLSVIEMAGVDQGALDALDPIESLFAEADALGLSPGSGGVRSGGDIVAMQQARNAASQEQEESAEALEASQVVKNMAPAMKLMEGGQGGMGQA